MIHNLMNGTVYCRWRSHRRGLRIFFSVPFFSTHTLSRKASYSTKDRKKTKCDGTCRCRSCPPPSSHRCRCRCRVRHHCDHFATTVMRSPRCFQRPSTVSKTIFDQAIGKTFEHTVHQGEFEGIYQRAFEDRLPAYGF